jgi:hypothetical protein
MKRSSCCFKLDIGTLLLGFFIAQARLQPRRLGRESGAS